MPFSHHSHSGQFCRHAKGLLEDVVKEAIRQGFQSYGLSEHVPRHRAVDLYPEEVRATPSPDRTKVPS
jgi:histidinol-phosphatase (PHP family)